MNECKYKCLKCNHEFTGKPGWTSCVSCGHNMILWVNYEEMFGDRNEQNEY